MFLKGFRRTLKKIYFAIILVVAITISSIIAYSYSYTTPKTRTLKVEIDYNPTYEGNALVKFQDEWYTRGSFMHLIDDPNQQNIQLNKDDSVLLRLLNYPSNVTQEWYANFSPLNYNYVFLNGGSVQGDITCAQISSADPPKFVVPQDGYYVFELGVVNVNAYFPGNSVGVWTFSVTVTHP